jgi:hypothetical protein
VQVAKLSHLFDPVASHIILSQIEEALDDVSDFIRDLSAGNGGVDWWRALGFRILIQMIQQYLHK